MMNDEQVSTNQPLYAITHKLKDLVYRWQVDDEFDTSLLDKVEMEHDEKCINCGYALLNLKSDLERVTTEIKRLEARKKAVKRNIDGLTQYTQFNMESAGKSEVDNGIVRLIIQNNPESVEVLNAADIEDKWFKKKVDITLDKKGIIQNMKETGEVPTGVEIVKKRSLRVK